MPKRFTDSEKFRDNWYRKLSPKHKCLWEFMLAECSAAGIFEIDYDSMSFHIGEEINESDLEVFEKKFHVIDDEKIFIPNFVEFQQSKSLFYRNNAHKNIIKELKEYKLEKFFKINDLEPPPKPLARGISKGKGKSKGKSRSKGKDAREKNLEVVEVPDFIDGDVWMAFVKHRGGSKFTKQAAKLTINKLTTWHNEGQNANEILEKSIMNGWKGVFPLDNKKRSVDDELNEFLARSRA